MTSTRILADQIERQYGATLTMLEATIAKCPDTLWADAVPPPPFWHEAYHAVFWCDNFVGPRGWRFERRPLGVDVDPRLFRTPADPLTPEALLGFVALAREHIAERLGAMTDAGLAESDAFGGGDVKPDFETVIHRLLYGLRHGQHHVGKLAQRLAAAGVHLERWVG